MKKPNVVFIFSDEWRRQATGFNGDPNCDTPVHDQLASESINCVNAVSGTPCCCPYRASLMTGLYPHQHGVAINDVELNPELYSIADAFNDGGYRTAYIGKWHLYGSPAGKCERRREPVPRSHQMRFDEWWGFECCHHYMDSPYYYNDDPEPQMWEGYDAFAQSELAAEYIREHAEEDQPFILMLSWGPPHFPLDNAPKEYLERYADREIELRLNVPEEHRDKAIEELRGYYAHIAALDDALKIVLNAIDENDRDNTLLVVTSDHGDMSWSQGLPHKTYPFEESIGVPFLLWYPAKFGNEGRACDALIDAPDVMPTLLELCELDVPDRLAGRSWVRELAGEPLHENDAALLSCMVPTTWMMWLGMPAYRGLRTRTHTYVRTHDGPWLLFDLESDPFQMRNLIGQPAARELVENLDALLTKKLEAVGDDFPDGRAWLEANGLDHYKEANGELRGRWVYPWETVV